MPFWNKPKEPETLQIPIRRASLDDTLNKLFCLVHTVLDLVSQTNRKIDKMSGAQETEAQAVTKLTAAFESLKTDVSGKLSSLATQLQAAQANQDFSAVDAVTAEIQAFQAQIDGTPAPAPASDPASGASTVSGGAQ